MKNFTFKLKTKIAKCLLEEVTYHFYNEEGSDDYYDDEEEQADTPFGQDAYILARENGLRISSDKDLTYYALDGRILVGALFCSQNSEYFAFDIVVHPDFRGKSIATKLVDIAMNEYREGKEIHGDDYYAEIEVINPFLINLMTRKGFKKVDNSPSGIIMKLK